MRRFYIFTVFCVWTSHATYTLEEYNKRVEIVNKMNGLYEKLLYTAIDDVQERNKIQEDFLQYCSTQFEKSISWIFDALKDPNSSLVKSLLKSNKFNFTTTETSIKTAFETAKIATDMGFWCSAVKQNETEAMNLVKFKKTVETEIPGLTTKLKDQMQSDFGGDVRKFLGPLITKHTFSFDESTQVFMQNTAASLRRDYPVGQWITVVSPNSATKKVCQRPGTFSISAPTQSGWTFTTFLLKDDQKYNIQAAVWALNGISTKRVQNNCNVEINNILKEAKYSCGSDEFTFFGVFNDEKVLFGASDANLFKSRDVIRKGWFSSSCKYRIGILA